MVRIGGASILNRTCPHLQLPSTGKFRALMVFSPNIRIRVAGDISSDGAQRQRRNLAPGPPWAER